MDLKEILELMWVKRAFEATARDEEFSKAFDYENVDMMRELCETRRGKKLDMTDDEIRSAIEAYNKYKGVFMKI